MLLFFQAFPLNNSSEFSLLKFIGTSRKSYLLFKPIGLPAIRKTHNMLAPSSFFPSRLLLKNTLTQANR